MVDKVKPMKSHLNQLRHRKSSKVGILFGKPDSAKLFFSGKPAPIDA